MANDYAPFCHHSPNLQSKKDCVDTCIITEYSTGDVAEVISRNTSSCYIPPHMNAFVTMVGFLGPCYIGSALPSSSPIKYYTDNDYNYYQDQRSGYKYKKSSMMLAGAGGIQKADLPFDKDYDFVDIGRFPLGNGEYDAVIDNEPIRIILLRGDFVNDIIKGTFKIKTRGPIPEWHLIGSEIIIGEQTSYPSVSYEITQSGFETPKSGWGHPLNHLPSSMKTGIGTEYGRKIYDISLPEGYVIKQTDIFPENTLINDKSSIKGMNIPVPFGPMGSDGHLTSTKGILHIPATNTLLIRNNMTCVPLKLRRWPIHNKTNLPFDFQEIQPGDNMGFDSLGNAAPSTPAVDLKKYYIGWKKPDQIWWNKDVKRPWVCKYGIHNGEWKTGKKLPFINTVENKNISGDMDVVVPDNFIPFSENSKTKIYRHIIDLSDPKGYKLEQEGRIEGLSFLIRIGRGINPFNWFFEPKFYEEDENGNLKDPCLTNIHYYDILARREINRSQILNIEMDVYVVFSNAGIKNNNVPTDYFEIPTQKILSLRWVRLCKTPAIMRLTGYDEELKKHQCKLQKEKFNIGSCSNKLHPIMDPSSLNDPLAAPYSSYMFTPGYDEYGMKNAGAFMDQPITFTAHPSLCAPKYRPKIKFNSCDSSGKITESFASLKFDSLVMSIKV